jgi:hypothetical protein
MGLASSVQQGEHVGSQHGVNVVSQRLRADVLADTKANPGPSADGCHFGQKESKSQRLMSQIAMPRTCGIFYHLIPDS